MRRTWATSLAVGALLVLTGCKTDNEHLNGAPPVVSAQPEAPTAQTLAWTDQAVSDALAAEKAARAAGGDDKAVLNAIDHTIETDVNHFLAAGGTPGQMLAGLKVAGDSPRNTPATQMAFKIVLSAMMTTPTGGGQGCPECKGT